MDLQLTGKRAVVTGGSKGIGKAIALTLAREGCDVVLVSRTQADLDAAATEIAAATGRTVVGIACDTGVDESVRGMMRAVISRLGGVDILVNAAAKPGGQQPPPRLAEITDEVFNEDMNVKVMGYLRCAREAAPHMTANGWGRIINISGLAARQTGSLIGSMRNVAVAALTKNLAEELGPLGINVTVVHPGLTRTEATAGVLARRAAAQGITTAEAESRMAEGNTVRRLIDASDIAAVVAFLASPLSVALNGDAIAAGGGAPRSIHY